MGCLRVFRSKKNVVPVAPGTLATLPLHTHQEIEAQVHELTLSVESLRRVVKQQDRDLDDAISGFYRRRQSDKMAAIRSKEEVEADQVTEAKKRLPKLTVDDFVRSALAKSSSRGGSAEQPSPESDTGG
jgi:predicted nucleic acid-binding protein